jgi:hypothetical protein
MQHMSSPSASAAVLVGIALFAILLGWSFFRTSGTRAPAGAPATLIVRCRNGHLFTTVWIPFVTFKAIRIGLMRIQYCPVGEHLTTVVPVDPSTLTELERRFAVNHPDSLVP